MIDKRHQCDNSVVHDKSGVSLQKGNLLAISRKNTIIINHS